VIAMDPCLVADWADCLMRKLHHKAQITEGKAKTINVFLSNRRLLFRRDSRRPIVSLLEDMLWFPRFVERTPVWLTSGHAKMDVSRHSGILGTINISGPGKIQFMIFVITHDSGADLILKLDQVGDQMIWVKFLRPSTPLRGEVRDHTISRPSEHRDILATCNFSISDFASDHCFLLFHGVCDHYRISLSPFPHTIVYEMTVKYEMANPCKILTPDEICP
jgi:hypothetical protein